MASASVVCVACAQSLPNSRDRKRLQSAPDRRTLSEVVSQVYPGAVTVFLPPGESSIVCRGCFGRLEKLQKLRTEVSRLEAVLESGVKRYGELIGAVGTSAPEQSTSRSPSTPWVRKRQCTSHVSRPPAKKHLMDSSSRRFMEQTQACDSPAVAVSSLYLILHLATALNCRSFFIFLSR